MPADAAEGPDSKLAELEARLRRSLADIENLRRRQVRELAMEREAERAHVAGAWLPVLDNLERALQHAGSDPAAIAQRMLAVRNQAIEIMAQLGYPRQDETAVRFDPRRHEVISVIDERDIRGGFVTEVVRPGYGSADHQLRPAAVVVNKPQG